MLPVYYVAHITRSTKTTFFTYHTTQHNSYKNHTPFAIRQLTINHWCKLQFKYVFCIHLFDYNPLYYSNNVYHNYYPFTKTTGHRPPIIINTISTSISHFIHRDSTNGYIAHWSTNCSKVHHKLPYNDHSPPYQSPYMSESKKRKGTQSYDTSTSVGSTLKKTKQNMLQLFTIKSIA